MIFKEIDFFLVDGSHGIDNSERVKWFTRELVANGFIKGFIDTGHCSNYVQEKIHNENTLDHQFEIINIDWRNNKVVTKWNKNITPPDCIDELILALAYEGKNKGGTHYGIFTEIIGVFGFYLVNKEMHKNVYWCEYDRGVKVPKETYNNNKEWFYTKNIYDKDVYDKDVK